MTFKRFFPSLLVLSLVISPLSSLQAVESVITEMQEAAAAFLDSLPAELKEKATFPMDPEGERVNWHFVPREREGVGLKDLDEEQKGKLTALLAAGLSARGHTKVDHIMDLESVLFLLEGEAHRDPDLYFITLFGQPAPDGAWGWRFEGHHLSLNFTIVKGKFLAEAPHFWGANPAKVPVGPTKGRRTLKEEEDVARQLLLSLSEKQQEKAIIEAKAPRDIYTGAKKKVSPLPSTGVAASEMTEDQLGVLNRLIDVYIGNMPSDLALTRWNQLREAGLENIVFAWAGSKEPGNPHYYRVQGPTFLIEYDNIQNNANHIHAVWRDFDGDFGRNLLAEHYEKHHKAPGGAN